MRFYLGTHMVGQNWFDLGVPLFVSTRRLKRRQSFPRPRTWWALDSGGFTELNKPPHTYQQTAREYAADIDRYVKGGMTKLAFVSPQDWMCEPFVITKTGLDVAEHQRRTVRNFLELRDLLGGIVAPVLQGWETDDYLRCWDLYHRSGVDLEWEPVIGVGSVCRRQNTADAGRIFRRLADNLLGTQLHGFGVKVTGLESYADCLASADSMAWSFRARRDAPLRGCAHKSCANCPRYAMRWRNEILARLGQLRMEVAA